MRPEAASHPIRSAVRLACGLVFAAAGVACSGDSDGRPDGGEDGARGAGSGASAEGVPRWEAHIRGDVFRKLVIEVDVARGFAPEPGVMDDVVAGFRSLLDKPDGIEVVIDETLEPRGASHAWTFEEEQALGDEHMSLALEPGVDRIHVLWVDGHDARDGSESAVLGLAWDHRHVVMYKQTLAAGCQSVLAALSDDLCRAAEVTVLSHELGHVIGLVDNGLPMVTPHEDPEHEHHSADPESLMYWQHERDGVFDVLLERLQGGDSALRFDAASLADISAVRDRRP